MSALNVSLLPHQYEVLADTTTKIIGTVGGYGNGKTYTAARKAIQLSSLNYGCTGIVTEPTYPMIRDIFVPEMKKALAEWNIPYTFNGSSSIFTLYLGSEPSTIICMSAENYERLVGINAAWGIMDEFDTSKMEVAISAYQKILGRIRVGEVRQLCMFTTPEGFRAAYKIFVEDAGPNKRLIRAKTSDNPFLPEDFIETLKSQYPPNLLEAYLNGEFINLAKSQVYSYFKRETHVKELDYSVNKVNIGQDFNIGGCVSILSVDIEGLCYIFDTVESYDTNCVCDNIKSELPKSVIEMFPDASGSANKTNSSRSDIQILRDAGFRINAPAKNGSVRDRINAVNQGFYNNQILIHPRCTRLIAALEQQAYDERGEPEKFSGAATIDDYNDALGYLIARKYGILRVRYTTTQNILR